jgi:hypothetical protein
MKLSRAIVADVICFLPPCRQVSTELMEHLPKPDYDNLRVLLVDEKSIGIGDVRQYLIPEK